MTKERSSAVKRLRGVVRKVGYLLGVSRPDDPIATETENRRKVMDEMVAKARAVNRVSRLRSDRDTLRRIREVRRGT